MADWWTTPKINWNTSDGIGYDDLNRIESNIKAIGVGTKRHIKGFGMTVSNSVPSQDGVITVYAGAGYTENGVPFQQPASSFTKNLNSWVPGNGSSYGGMAPAVTVAAITWYYIFAIVNPIDGTMEIMFDDNPSGTNISSGTYTDKRRVGCFKTNQAGSYGSFTVMEMYAIDGTTYINPTYAYAQGTVFNNSAGINNAYQNSTLSLGPGVALPALNVQAKLNVLVDDCDFGLISKYGSVFTIPSPFVSGGIYKGEFIYINSAFLEKGAIDAEIMTDTNAQIQLALYRSAGPPYGSIEVRVRGFYDEREP